VVVAQRRWTILRGGVSAQRPAKRTTIFLEVNRASARILRKRGAHPPTTERAPTCASTENEEALRSSQRGDSDAVQSINDSPEATAIGTPDAEAAEFDTRSEEMNTVDEAEPSADAEKSETPESPRAAPAVVKPARREGWSRDWWKPQYIDFGSPLLVKLFARLPTGLKNYLMHLEERYPVNEELPTSDGERHSAEFILQFSFPAACPEFVDTSEAVEHGDLALSALHD
jgi:hypothetical protein